MALTTNSLVDKLIGKPLATDDDREEKIDVLTGIPTLGLDGLGSAAYGPEAALTILLPLGALGLVYIGPITLVILLLLGILYLSYRQTISAYPNGGGSYTVAKENLGIHAGLLGAAALMLDYTLNVAVGISTGVGALISAAPSLQPHTLLLCLGMLALITYTNLRGVRESGVLFALPTYLFVGTLLWVLALGINNVLHSAGHPHSLIAPSPLPPATATVSLWLLLRAFASGCTAMTGVEAVSNGMPAFKQPAVKYAKWTLTGIVGILGILLAGIAYLSHAYGIGAMDQTKPGYQSVLSQLVFAVAGRGVFYYITIASILTVLALSANTSYAGFPRLCRIVAQDSYLPRPFAELGRRLVYSFGIVFLTGVSGLLLIIFGGITDRLIPLFAVGAFLAFTTSQAGMVAHWRRYLRAPGESKPGMTKSRARTALLINAVGVTITVIALIVIIIAKFAEGAWITLLIIPILLAAFWTIKRHYVRVARHTRTTRPLDLAHLEPPVVIVPVEGWNRLTERALRFGLRLSPDVSAVHVLSSNHGEKQGKKWTRVKTSFEEELETLRAQWSEQVVNPARQAGQPAPELVIMPSPYRKLVEPLLDYIDEIKVRNPGRHIAVVIPELVETRWWERLLHTHRAARLKTALLLSGDRAVVVISVPWYLEEFSDDSRPPGGQVRAWQEV